MFLGFLMCSFLCLGLACLGRFPERGELWLARCSGPQHDSPGTRGGPWAPATPNHLPNSLPNKVFCFFLWVLVASESVSGRILLVFREQVASVSSFGPSSSSPCSSSVRHGVLGSLGGCAVTMTFFLLGRQG